MIFIPVWQSARNKLRYDFRSVYHTGIYRTISLQAMVVCSQDQLMRYATDDRQTDTFSSLVLFLDASVRVRLFYCCLKILLKARHVVPTQMIHVYCMNQCVSEMLQARNSPYPYITDHWTVALVTTIQHILKQLLHYFPTVIEIFLKTHRTR